MIPYKNYRYIYPPRPENKTTSGELHKYIGSYIAQPKLNGSNLTVYTNGDKVIFMNRHKKEMSVDIPHKTIQDLHRGNGWMVINGEYMNKSKKSSNETVFNKKFVIFDILVFNGRQTVGQTFKERVSLLEQNFTTKEYDGFINKHNEDIFIVKTFDKNFISLYQKLTEIDMYEGLVLKEVNAKLKNGISIKNNINSQIKVRKETKNYSF